MQTQTVLNAGSVGAVGHFENYTPAVSRISTSDLPYDVLHFKEGDI